MEDDENLVNEENKPKKIEVVAGDGELNISPVSRYIEVEKPRPKDNRKIVIPDVKEAVSNKKNNSSKDNTNNTSNANTNANENKNVNEEN